MRGTALLFLALAFSSPVAAQAARVPPDIGTRVVNAYVAPNLAAFAEATERLSENMRALCEKPSDDTLAEARAGFAETVPAWGRVSVLRFGPLIEENRFEHFFFWPDPRGVTLRQVQAIIATKDPTATTPAELAGKSVAVQGLPALEFVLHGSDTEALAGGAGAYRCRYGSAIADNLAGRASELAAAWAPGAPFHTAFARPAAGNALYRSPAEVAGEVVKALTTTLQFVRFAELLPALGETPEKANGRRAPFWRSDLTFALLAAQINGAIGLLQSAGFETQLDARSQPYLNSVLFDLKHAVEAVQRVEQPAQTAFAEGEDRGRLTYANLALDGANERIGTQFSVAIGLTMGFNALDGD